MASSSHFYKIAIVLIALFSFHGLSAQVSSQSPINGTAKESTFFAFQNPAYPRDCNEVFDTCSSSASSGVYLIKPDGYPEPFEAYCDYSTNSEGWTVILRRFDGSVYFKRNWSQYKTGFGFLSTEFWLGNEKLAYLTNQAQYELRVDITLDNGTTCDFSYQDFRISDEWSDYTITNAGTYSSDVVCNFEGRDDSTPTDCNDVYSAGYRQDGVYSIRPVEWNGQPFNVFCNMSIDGGNWTEIQRRVNGSTDFYHNWISYKEGFGNIEHEFWLGNQKLHYLTKQARYEYRVNFVHGSSSYHNKYDGFRISDESNKYKVTLVGSRTGTKGHSLNSTLDVAFSTYDQDNDGQSDHCAQLHRGGWWYGGIFSKHSHSFCDNWFDGSLYGICSYANLNGDFNGRDGENIFHAHPYTCHVTYTEMKIRRLQ